jgi:hypothetical protein
VFQMDISKTSLIRPASWELETAAIRRLVSYG